MTITVHVYFLHLKEVGYHVFRAALVIGELDVSRRFYLFSSYTGGTEITWGWGETSASFYSQEKLFLSKWMPDFLGLNPAYHLFAQ